MPSPEAQARYRLVKRLLDILLAAAALGLALPLMLLGLILIRYESAGSPIFVHRRVGLDGRTFAMYKLRTMVVGAAAMEAALSAEAGLEGPVFKRRDDPRITRVGRWLRRLSLDELPQLFNVLRGDMSLVGPRPLPPHQVDWSDHRFRKRCTVLPGLTGQWQVTGRVMHVDYDTWLGQDCWYVDHHSLGLDVVILLRTLPAVLRGEGAW